MKPLPYVSSPGSIKRALEKIKDASVPTVVSQDFVKNNLGIKGGPGNQVTSFLRKIGFSSGSGEPTEIYKKFRNSDTASSAIIEALRFGYNPLKERNENFHSISDGKLRELVVEVTGAAKDSRVVDLVVACIRQMKAYISNSSAPASANSDPGTGLVPHHPNRSDGDPRRRSSGVGLNLGYTINLNLPATSDIAVFHAIFSALKEHLLQEPDLG